MKVKFSKLNISDKNILTINKIIKSGWLTHGKFTQLFENEIKKITKAKYAITVSSCTAGLHLSCIAAGFKNGDEVIVPAQTHTATAHAVEYTGAKAVLVDSEFPSGNISLKEIKKNITKRTKGLIVVHMGGYPCDMTSIAKFCKKKKLILIQDCAHSVGTKWKKKHVGNFGISGVFSFYPTKQITTGEGGAVFTNNKTIFNKIKKLKAFGIDKDLKDRKKPGEYNVKELGYNYRMTDFQAALGYFQLKNYSKNIKRRHEIAKRYIKKFSKNKYIKFLPFDKNNSYFIFQVFCKNRDRVLLGLKKKNIGFSIHYLKPLNKMSYYKKKYNLMNKNFYNSNKYSNMNISLPNYPKLTNKEIDYICDNIKKLCN